MEFVLGSQADLSEMLPTSTTAESSVKLEEGSRWKQIQSKSRESRRSSLFDMVIDKAITFKELRLEVGITSVDFNYLNYLPSSA
jgi:hypothetical protein